MTPRLSSRLKLRRRPGAFFSDTSENAAEMIILLLFFVAIFYRK